MAPVADLFLLEHGLRSNKVDELHAAWLGAIAKWQHKLLIRERGQDSWYFALGPVGDSAILVWPALKRTASQNSSLVTYFKPVIPQLEPCFLAITSLGDWEACTYQFRSPAWQSAHMWDEPFAGHAAVQFDAPEALLRIAALNAFWALNLTFLQALARHLGVVVPSGGRAFDVCFALVRFSLPELSEQEVLEILAKRAVALKQRSEDASGSEVLQTEEAGQFLSKDDHKELQKEAQKNMSNKGDLADFTDALRSRRQALGGGGSGGGSERGPRRHQVPPSQITHAQAKMLCPPGAFVWRSLTEGQWLGRLPPLGEHSRSWRRYGERAACVLILRILWTEYCELRGAPLSSVPIDMLFESSTLQPNSASEPATGASGSSSSQAAAAAPARQRNAGAKAAPRNTGSRNVPTASLSEPTSNATSAASEAASSSGQKRQQKRKR